MASDKTEMRKKKDIPQSLDVYSSFYGMELDEKQKVYRDSIWDPNIDVVFCQISADFRNDSYRVLSYYADNCFLHLFLSPFRFFESVYNSPLYNNKF